MRCYFCIVQNVSSEEPISGILLIMMEQRCSLLVAEMRLMSFLCTAWDLSTSLSLNFDAFCFKVSNFTNRFIF